MTLQEALKQQRMQTVVVDQGSGVLIAALSKKYSYVLTARHNLLLNPENFDEDGFKNKEDLEILDQNDNRLPVLDYFYHRSEDIDLAIILVEFRDYLPINLCFSTPSNYKIRLAGYPRTRRHLDTMEDKYASYELEYADSIGNREVYRVIEDVDIDSVVGFSGGGVFVFDQDTSTVSLSMIETRMDGNPEEESHGRIQCFKHSSFNDILNVNSYLNEPLAQILPTHLTSFEQCVQKIFQYNNWVDRDKLANVKGTIEDFARDRIEDIEVSPLALFEKFKLKFSENGMLNETIVSREHWISLLELLILSILVDRPAEVNLDYIDKVLTSRRLVFIDSEHPWTHHFKEVITSKYNELIESGILVVRSQKSSNKVYISNEKLAQSQKKLNISRANTDKSSIANANKNKELKLCLIDLLALHDECVNNKEDDFEEIDTLNGEAVNIKLRDEYSTFLSTEKDAI